MWWGAMSPGPWHQIFVEVHRPVRPVRIIGFRGFPQGVAHAHPGAADQLLLDQLGVEGAAELIGAVHLRDRDIARLVVHLDIDDQRRMREAGHRCHFPGVGIDVRQGDEEDAAARHGAALLELCRPAGGRRGDRARGRAAHVDVAVAVGGQGRPGRLRVPARQLPASPSAPPWRLRSPHCRPGACPATRTSPCNGDRCRCRRYRRRRRPPAPRGFRPRSGG